MLYRNNAGYHDKILRLILGLRPANQRRRNFVKTSLIGWVQTYYQPWIWYNTIHWNGNATLRKFSSIAAVLGVIILTNFGDDISVQPNMIITATLKCANIHSKIGRQSERVISIGLLHKYHNARLSHLTIHHFVTESAHVCTFLLRNSALWDVCIMHCAVCKLQIYYSILAYCFTSAIFQINSRCIIEISIYNSMFCISQNHNARISFSALCTLMWYWYVLLYNIIMILSKHYSVDCVWRALVFGTGTQVRTVWDWLVIPSKLNLN